MTRPEVAEDAQFLMNVCVHAAASRAADGGDGAKIHDHPMALWRVFVGHVLFEAREHHNYAS